jgi:threonyl-tRNA synthetase
MKDKQVDNLEVIRHSLSHVLACAVTELYPQVKLAIGPAIDNGFYYDFDFGTEGISEGDLSKIEKKMKEIISRNLSFERRELNIDEAIALMKDRGEIYKEELINDLAEAGTTEVSFYKLGAFDDLCKGPHLEASGKIPVGSFKLNKLAGAYWRGDEKNKMLTRIYGLAFASKQDLEDYVALMIEAEKRDHRKLGKELDLFVFSDLVGKGLPMLTAKGATIRRELERFIVDEEIKRGYQHVVTPDLAHLDLYKKSGHYPYYKESMYAPIIIDEEEFMLRPMACPHHFELYLSKPHSYRDLPMRIAELAKLYRYEQSGELTGLIRARAFCLADSHIICANPEQAKSEVAGVLDLIDFVIQTFGLSKGGDYSYRLSLGDRSDDTKYFKNDEAWEIAENNLRDVLTERGDKFTEALGEAAFYGPKIDVQMKNVMGKEDTAFTVQYDFVMPERFALNYIDSDGQTKQGIVVHRSSIGALERIMAFLIEYYAGNFPVWLAPTQIKLLSVSAKHHDYCQKLAEEFKALKFRVEVDDGDETVGNKTRKAVNEKIPYILVIGDKEMESTNLNIRDRGEQKTREISKEDFIKEVGEKIKDRI